MNTITNKTRKPLSIPLAGGKKLHLGPGKTGQITSTDAARAVLVKLVEAGTIEIQAGDAGSSFNRLAGQARGSEMIGSSGGSAGRRSGDR